MKCPLCPDSVLDVTFHAGIELDICPTCRGVWLDRGELDRIAASAAAGAPRVDRPATPQWSTNHGEDGSRWDDDDRDDDRDDHRDHRDQRAGDGRRSKKRKKSLASRLGDVFEEIIDM
jgi:Zn-finger nucleic acid-binding protein